MNTNTTTETPLPENMEEAISAVRLHAGHRMPEGYAWEAVRAARQWANAPVDPANPREAIRNEYRATVEACAKIARQMLSAEVR